MGEAAELQVQVMGKRLSPNIYTNWPSGCGEKTEEKDDCCMLVFKFAKKQVVSVYRFEARELTKFSLSHQKYGMVQDRRMDKKPQMIF